MNATGNELDFLRAWTGWFCHKLADRSPHSGDDLFPVCFRCAGWQLGLAATYFRLLTGGEWRRRFPTVRVAMQCVALMLPLAIDGMGNALHLWNSPGWLRALTGLGVGISAPWLLAPLAHSPGQTERPALENLRPLLRPALTGSIAVGLLVRECDPIVFRILAVTAAAGWLFSIGHFLLVWACAYGSAAARQARQIFSRREANQ